MGPLIMKYIGNQPYQRLFDSFTHKWNYQSEVNPAIGINPVDIPSSWMNLATGEKFICIDNTIDANVWQGNLGTVIS